MGAGNLDHLDDEQLLAWFEGLLADTVDRYPGAPEELRYGDHPLQVIDLWGDRASELWVISIHGGYFAAEYDRTVNEPLSRRLAADGMAVANIEYRRAGSAGDPAETVADVRAAIAAVIDLVPEGSRVVVTGHSAGGYLALTGAVHAGIDAVVPLAPVTDLVATARGGWDGGEIAGWIGAPLGDGSGSWSALQPEAVGMATARIVAIHGAEDRVVPAALTREFVARHPEIRLRELPETGHYEFLDPGSVAVAAALDEIRAVDSRG